MYEVVFFDLDIGKIRRVFATDLGVAFCALEICNVDFKNHFLKVRFIEK